MSYPHLLSIIFFVFISVRSGYSQGAVNNIGYHNLNVEAGLPSNEVYHVIQDRRGYLWFGTDNGLVKYDGKNMKYFNMTNGLTDNVVFKLFEDEKGRIWCSTYNSKLCYITSDDKIHPYKYNHKINGWIRNNSVAKQVIISFQTKNDTVRLGYRANGGIEIHPDGSLKKRTNKSLLSVERHGGDGIVQVNHAHYKYANASGALNISINDLITSKHYKTKDITANTPSIEIIDGERTCVSFSNLILIMNHESILSVYECPNEIIKIDLIGSILWVSQLHNGTIGYSINNNKLIPNYHFFEDLSITSVCRDRNHGYWFSSLENGISFLPNIDYRSVRVTGDDANILHALPLGDNLFVCDNENGIKRFDQNFTCQNEYIAKTGRVFHLYKSHTRENQPTIGYITANGSHQYNLKNDLFTQNDNNPVFQLRHSHKNTLVSVTSSSFIIDDLSNNTCVVQEHKNGTSNSLGKGEFVLNYVNNHMSLFKIFNNRLECKKDIELDQNIGTIKVYNNLYYCVTRSGALYQLDNNLKLNKVYQVPENIIVNDFVIDDKSLWIASNQGLYKTDFDSKEVVNYWNGTVKQLFKGDDRLTFCTSKSLHSIKDFDFIDHSTIEIDKVLINGVESSLDKVSHNQNNIEFQFKSIGTIPGKNYAFECVLIGDDTTRTISSSNSIQFPSLRSGKYTFYVINQANGQRSNLVEFEILTPFWKRTWVMISIAVLLLLILIFVGIMISRQREKKLKLQTQLVELKSQALRAQMNPHFIFNSMNVVQSLISSNDFDKASSSIVKLSRLIRNTLNYSQETMVSLHDEIEFTKNYFDLENLRMNGSMSLTIENEHNLDLSTIQIPPICIQPIVENAIIHGIVPSEEKGVIRIIVERSDTTISITVENNGLKFVPKRTNHDSKGLELIRNRIKILHPKNELTLPNKSARTLHNQITKVIIKLQQ